LCRGLLETKVLDFRPYPQVILIFTNVGHSTVNVRNSETTMRALLPLSSHRAVRSRASVPHRPCEPGYRMVRLDKFSWRPPTSLYLPLRPASHLRLGGQARESRRHRC